MRDSIVGYVSEANNKMSANIAATTTAALRVFGERQAAKDAQIDQHLQDLDRGVSRIQRDQQEMREALAKLEKVVTAREAAAPAGHLSLIHI
eukprot:87900-Pyramimonas_sp.AAC.1